jgi:TPR repeat protein
MYSMGYLYAEGLGVKPDYRLAQTWYQKSADHGKTIALYSIGLLHLGGGRHTAGLCYSTAMVREGRRKGRLFGTELANGQSFLLLNARDCCRNCSKGSVTARAVSQRRESAQIVLIMCST